MCCWHWRHAPRGSRASSGSSTRRHGSRCLVAQPGLVAHAHNVPGAVAAASPKARALLADPAGCALCLPACCQVLAVLSVLASRMASGQLARQQLTALQASLAGRQWLWAGNLQAWVGLADEPVVADDPQLAAVMAAVPGVALLQLPAQQGPLRTTACSGDGSAVQLATDAGAAAVAAGMAAAATDAAGGGADGRAAPHALQQLLALLGVHPLSQAVSSELSYEVWCSAAGCPACIVHACTQPQVFTPTAYAWSAACLCSHGCHHHRAVWLEL